MFHLLRVINLILYIEKIIKYNITVNNICGKDENTFHNNIDSECNCWGWTEFAKTTKCLPIKYVEIVMIQKRCCKRYIEPSEYFDRHIQEFNSFEKFYKQLLGDICMFKEDMSVLEEYDKSSCEIMNIWEKIITKYINIKTIASNLHSKKHELSITYNELFFKIGDKEDICYT